MDAETAWLLLSKMDVIGDAQKRTLLEHFSSPIEIFAASVRELAPFAGKYTRAILRTPRRVSVEAERDWLSQPQHFLVPLSDARYPSALRNITSPPLLLYAIGDVDLLTRPAIAVVGSRNPTPSGRETALDFAYRLARCGLSVVSGLAMGIDAAAHHGALRAGGCTIAVTGCGPDRIYPRRNATLHRDIAKHGLLLTEFAPATPPREHHFPRRNRIISGLSLGVLVVEATARSGSLITARLAAEQGREVFAVPGPIQSPLSRGCHKLIRDGAKLVEETAHILEELPPGCFHLASDDSEAGDDERALDASAPPVAPPTALEQKIMEAASFTPATVDQIIQRSGLTAAAVSAAIITMELKEYLTKNADGTYVRTRRRT